MGRVCSYWLHVWTTRQATEERMLMWIRQRKMQRSSTKMGRRFGVQITRLSLISSPNEIDPFWLPLMLLTRSSTATRLERYYHASFYFIFSTSRFRYSISYKAEWEYFLWKGHYAKGGGIGKICKEFSKSPAVLYLRSELKGHFKR